MSGIKTPDIVYQNASDSAQLLSQQPPPPPVPAPARAHLPRAPTADVVRLVLYCRVVRGIFGVSTIFLLPQSCSGKIGLTRREPGRAGAPPHGFLRSCTAWGAVRLAKNKQRRTDTHATKRRASEPINQPRARRDPGIRYTHQPHHQ